MRLSKTNCLIVYPQYTSPKENFAYSYPLSCQVLIFMNTNMVYQFFWGGGGGFLSKVMVLLFSLSFFVSILKS